MMSMLWKVILAGVLLALVALALATLQSPSAVLWSELNAVVLESDDWGLAGFVPHAGVWEGRDKEALQPGPFPEVYWGTTLEDSAMVADLCGVLESVRDRDGLPAVFQPNYVMSSLAYQPGEEGMAWHRYDLPEFPPAYARPGMWQAVQKGIRTGLWYPEFHAAWHYDPRHRMDRGLSTPLAETLTLEGVTLFPDSEGARELGPWRSPGLLAGELHNATAIFEDVFGRPVASIIAPDYTWTDATEEIWMDQDIRIIQAKREQRNPELRSGMAGRLQKYLLRQWSTLARRDRIYLERNVRLEPVQDTDPQAVALRAVGATHLAWQEGKPAIVETHRVNFSHCDTAVVKAGQEALGTYLRGVSGTDLDPTFLTDFEVAQLTSTGVSYCVRGEYLVLRNASRSRRFVVIPPSEDSGQQSNRLFAVNSGDVRVIDW